MAAASLSAAVATPTGKREATLTLTSDQATGTVYVVVTGSVTTPSHAQIVAGNDNSGNPALFARSTAGVLSVSISATGIERVPTRLYAHYTQVNGAAENSTPVTSNGFWLHDVGAGTMVANQTSSEITAAYPTLAASGTFGSGTITWYYKNAVGSWVALTDGAWTTAQQMTAQFSRPVTVRAVLTGSTSPTLMWEVR